MLTSTHKKISRKKGYTLLEFVVVLTIFSIMSSVSIFNYNEYQAKIKETNVTQDIALSIRQAQVYGLSSSDRIVGRNELDEDNVADVVFGSNDNNSGYFDGQSIVDITQDRSVRGVMISPLDNSLVIFEDTVKNKIYDEGLDIVIDRRAIDVSGVEILGIDVCNGAPNCSNVVMDRLDVAFQRPYPDAFISINANSSTTYDFASIIIGSGLDNDSYVEISSIGNITAKKNYE